MKAILHANIILPDSVLPDHALLYDGHILAMLPSDAIPGDVQSLDAGGLYLLPGLIDQHIHGFAGYDAMDGDPQGLLRMGEALCAHGVTGFVPTTVSMGEAGIDRALDSVRAAMAEPQPGARILGAHLEGPYLNPQKKGAHAERYLKAPLREYVERHLDVLRALTAAPELDPAFIGWAAGHKLVVSLGHSMATYEQAWAAFDSGASQVTHLFNGMSGVHHQEPGLAGAALLRDGIYAELIADTVHVRKELYPLIYRCKGPGGVILISDCTRAGGMPPGHYTLGNMDVYTDATSSRLADGSLAGSVLTLERAVYNFRKHADIPLHEAVAMASRNPAAQLGLARECGSIALGLRADFALADEEFNIRSTWIGGERVYAAG